MKFRRDISTDHPAVVGERRRSRSAFLNLLVDAAGLVDPYGDTDRDQRRDPEAEFRDWAERADELAECAELVRSGGYADHTSPLPLHGGEQVFFVLHDAALIQPSALIDVGTVTITDTRVVFQSTTQAQQFRHAGRLSHRHHESEPITYFEAPDKTVGIRYEPATAFRFRRRLDVALAWADGDPGAMGAALQAELADHLGKRPDALPVR